MQGQTKREIKDNEMYEGLSIDIIYIQGTNT